MKLNLGCGKNYIQSSSPKKDWVNVDFNKNVKADLYFDLDKINYPIPSNTFEYILADNVLEHLDNLIPVMEELYRISKHEAIIEVIVPLYPTMFWGRDPTHKIPFTYRTFDYFTEENYHNYYSNARFKILRTQIILHNKLRFFNFLFNFGETYRKFICEFFSQFFPPALIKFELEVVKNEPW